MYHDKFQFLAPVSGTVTRIYGQFMEIATPVVKEGGVVVVKLHKVNMKNGTIEAVVMELPDGTLHPYLE